MGGAAGGGAGGKLALGWLHAVSTALGFALCPRTPSLPQWGGFLLIIRSGKDNYQARDHR